MPTLKTPQKEDTKNPNSINQTGKKGKTLGAEHASHGDFGAGARQSSAAGKTQSKKS